MPSARRLLFVSRPVVGTVALLAMLTVSLGWSAPGHRTITKVAVSMLPDDMPAWVRDGAAAEIAAYQANEPDRWRGVRLPAMGHENNADHYIDVELLAQYGMTLRTLPALRYQFVEAQVLASEHAHAAAEGDAKPEDKSGFNPETVGMLPYAIAEHYAKLTSSMLTARIFESLNDPAHGVELAAARANVMHEMGVLSHFVGDAGQPLHTTIHHHGWVGDNPEHYTTEHAFHAYIDGDVVALHALNPEGLEAFAKPIADISADGVWDASIGLIERSYAALVPLYELEKSGDLKREPGRRFIGERLADSASVLGGLYRRAWLEAEPTPKQISDTARYDAMGAEQSWKQKAATPAETAEKH